MAWNLLQILNNEMSPFRTGSAQKCSGTVSMKAAGMYQCRFQEVGIMNMRVFFSGLALLLLTGTFLPVQANVIVLKQGADLTASGGLATEFAGVTFANVAAQDVQDSSMMSNTASTDCWRAYGAETLSTFHTFQLLKFDLAALAGKTIEKAQIRLFSNSGNTGATGMYVARITTHDWDEASVCRASWSGAPYPTKNWGPSANTFFGATDYVTQTTFDAVATGGWLVKDVSADVQGFVNGTNFNFGWWMSTGNRPIRTSEYVYTDGSTGYGPALFISYTPEPATLVLLMAGSVVALARRRKI